MSKWPFWGGLIALLVACGRIVYTSLDISGTLVEKLLLIATFLVLLSHVLHHAGAPVPDLLPWLPSLGSAGN